MSGTEVQGVFSSAIASYSSNQSVSLKAVGIQFALMSGISIATVLAFSFFRPREKKVYAPKIKYQLPAPADPLDDPDYEPPPPTISNSFWAWLSPVIHLKEEQTTANVGLDASTFLRFLRLLRHSFSVISLIGVALLVVNIIYNVKYVPSEARSFLSLLTIADLKGSWMWPALAASYFFNFTIMYFVWRNWKAMVLLRHMWFRSPAYQTKVYSRTLMVTRIRKDYRSDAGLVALMGLLKVDGIKIGPDIDCATIGRRIGDFPELVENHNKAVEDLEKNLVKYLKDGKMAAKRPTVRKGGLFGLIGGQKHDAIDYHSKEIKFLRDKIDTQRQHIESLRRREKRRKGSQEYGSRIEGENYGFVTFKTIAEAHRIAKAHPGKLKELHGARLHLAPMPQDIVWKNISREPAEIKSRTIFGFVVIAVVCFLNTIPLLGISALANLNALTAYVGFLERWQKAGQWGNWTFSLVSGILPPVIAFIFGYFLPIVIRSLSRYQGAQTRSRLDRATTARYFAFIIISNLIVFSLLGVVYQAISQVIFTIGKHKSVKEVFQGLQDIPYKIQKTYVNQSSYWLTWLPLRGFLVIFELIQLVKLALVSIRRYMFSHTPRTIREMTKPGYFDYPVVIVNLLFVTAVGMIYAPLAPLVAFGACAIFWFSSIVYKYQLLYVYISRAESGGRMWNVYVNRLLVCCVLMQILMVLTVGLIRRRWLDTISAAPPVLILLAFKIWIRKAYGNKFRYYEPTAQEAEQEKRMSLSEKRLKISDLEKRFLHPALQHNKLYKIMVHKNQEEAAKEVLSVYPWFMDKRDHAFVKIKGVREDNLEYDPARDGPVDEQHQNDWDARSQASTEMLGGISTRPSTPGTEELYKGYPMGTEESPITSYRFGGPPQLPVNNPSTDYLLTQEQQSDLGYQGRQPLRDDRYASHNRYANGMGMHSKSQESITGVPLLQNAPTYDMNRMRSDSVGDHSPGSNGSPYPPTAYAQPPPIGYTPPQNQSTSTLSEDNTTRGPWGSTSDLSSARNLPQAGSQGLGYGLPPGARTGYPEDDRNPLMAHRQRTGSTPSTPAPSYPGTGTYPSRQGSDVPGYGYGYGGGNGMRSVTSPESMPISRRDSPTSYLPTNQDLTGQGTLGQHIRQASSGQYEMFSEQGQRRASPGGPRQQGPGGPRSNPNQPQYHGY